MSEMTLHCLIQHVTHEHSPYKHSNTTISENDTVRVVNLQGLNFCGLGNYKTIMGLYSVA